MVHHLRGERRDVHRLWVDGRSLRQARLSVLRGQLALGGLLRQHSGGRRTNGCPEPVPACAAGTLYLARLGPHLLLPARVSQRRSRKGTAPRRAAPCTGQRRAVVRTVHRRPSDHGVLPALGEGAGDRPYVQPRASLPERRGSADHTRRRATGGSARAPGPPSRVSTAALVASGAMSWRQPPPCTSAAPSRAPVLSSYLHQTAATGGQQLRVLLTSPVPVPSRRLPRDSPRVDSSVSHGVFHPAS